MELYKAIKHPYFVLHLSLCSLVPLGGCVPTWGSHFIGKEDLAKGDYIDLNKVPSREEVEKGQSSRDASDLEDRLHLEGELLKNKQEEKALREKFFAPSPLAKPLSQPPPLPQTPSSSQPKRKP